MATLIGNLAIPPEGWPYAGIDYVHEQTRMALEYLKNCAPKRWMSHRIPVFDVVRTYRHKGFFPVAGNRNNRVRIVHFARAFACGGRRRSRLP